MKLSIIKQKLDYYDSKKGFLRWIFGDDPTIQLLRNFYNRLNEKQVKTLSFRRQLYLLNILNEETQYNPRLSGFVIRRLIAHFPSFNLLVKYEKFQDGFDLKYFKKNKQTIFNILTTIQNIGELTNRIIDEVLNHRDLDGLLKITNCLKNKPYTGMFSENQLISLFQQSEIYGIDSVIQLLNIAPKESLTPEVIDTMIEEGKKKNTLLAVIGFLNRLISLARTEPSPSTQSRAKPVTLNTSVVNAIVPGRRQVQNREFPSRFNFCNFFKDFSYSPNQEKIAEIKKPLEQLVSHCVL